MKYQSVSEAIIAEDVNNREELIQLIQYRFGHCENISDIELLEKINVYHSENVHKKEKYFVANDPIDW
jgi:hypothetical protein